MCQNFQKNLLLVLDDALSSVQSVITTLDPNWPGLAQYEKDAGLALNAVSNWQSGTPAQDVVEILDDLITDISAFPVPAEYEPVIVIALDGVKSVIVLLEEHSTGPTQTAAAAIINRTAPTNPSTVGAEQANPPRTKLPWSPPTVVYEGVRQFTTAWNKEVSQHPAIAHLKMKTPKKWGILP